MERIISIKPPYLWLQPHMLKQILLLRKTNESSITASNFHICLFKSTLHGLWNFNIPDQASAEWSFFDVEFCFSHLHLIILLDLALSPNMIKSYISLSIQLRYRNNEHSS